MADATHPLRGNHSTGGPVLASMIVRRPSSVWNRS
jgi:hypothetical protein